MTKNKKTVTQYMDGFRATNHAMILECLTDDVEWSIPGMFNVSGKAAFDEQIENDAFVGSPTITISRLTEENDVVVAEGRVQSQFKNGDKLDVLFCDVFEMRDGKIKKLSSFLMHQ